MVAGWDQPVDFSSWVTPVCFREATSRCKVPPFMPMASRL